MTDIVERLRDLETRHRGFFLGEAADEIERLRAELYELLRAFVGIDRYDIERDDMVRWLIDTKGFTPKAAAKAIKSYIETRRFIEAGGRKGEQ
jgi:hypothetical protein